MVGFNKPITVAVVVVDDRPLIREGLLPWR